MAAMQPSERSRSTRMTLPGLPWDSNERRSLQSPLAASGGECGVQIVRQHGRRWNRFGLLNRRYTIWTYVQCVAAKAFHHSFTMPRSIGRFKRLVKKDRPACKGNDHGDWDGRTWINRY